MRENIDDKLLVLIPITRIGDKPIRAIKSLSKNRSDVKIVASFNRCITSEDGPLLAILNGMSAIVLNVKNILNPIEHACFILKSCFERIAINLNHPLVWLCDDDELLLESKDIKYICERIRIGVAVWGPYKIFNEKNGEAKTGYAFYSHNNLTNSRVQRLIDEMELPKISYKISDTIQGSITGIFAPYSAYLSAFNYYLKTNCSSGARIEVTILSQRGISIERYRNPVATIYLHDSQAGKSISNIDYLGDEIRFRSYALLQSNGLKEFFLLSISGYGAIWIFSALLRYLRFVLVNKAKSLFKLKK
jgi:hypothetical protein